MCQFSMTIRADDLGLKLFGLKAAVFYGDPLVYDRWKWLKRHLMPGPLRTLDAGCGTGVFTMYAAKVGNQAIGLSFDESNNHKARRRARILEISSVDFVEVDLRDLTMVSDQLGPFDQVICFETIEHILDDRKLLRDLSSALKPGGRFLLTTPFKGYKPLLGDRVSGIEDGGHVRWGYTHIEIQTLFDECGLDVQVQEYISGYVSQRLCNLMRLLGRIDANLARVAVFPLRIFQCIDGPLTNFIRYPFASIAVVGVKRKGSTAKSTRYHTPKYIGQDGR